MSINRKRKRPHRQPYKLNKDASKAVQSQAAQQDSKPHPIAWVDGQFIYA